MSDDWCKTCPKPGNCCKKLHLTYGEKSINPGQPPVFWNDEGIQAAKNWLNENNFPFEPIEICETWKGENGREFSSYWYRCPKLGPTGLCTIYKDRPQLCKDFKAGSDSLCVFNDQHQLREEYK